MKNLDQTLQEFKLYSYDNIPDTHKQHPYYKSINQDHPLLIAVINYLPNDYEVDLYFQCSQDTDHTGKISYYFESNCEHILFKSDKHDCIMELTIDFHKNYNIKIFNGQIIEISKYILFHCIQNAPLIETPNKYKALHVNKVAKWIECREQQYDYLQGIVKERKAENQRIENQINETIKSLGNPRVEIYQNKTYVYAPLFEIIFDHSKKAAHLTTQIKFTGNIQDVINLQKKQS